MNLTALEWACIALIVIILLAIVLRRWFPWGAMLAVKYNGSAQGSLCDKTKQLAEKFLADRFTIELAREMSDTADDIAHDTADIAENAELTDTATSKLILDSMLHHYIYDKEPNSISREAIESNFAVLERAFSDDKWAAQSCFDKSTVERVTKITKAMINNEKLRERELAATHSSPRECYRRAKVASLVQRGDSTVRAEIDRLKDELSQKNVDLRRKDEEMDILRKRERELEREHNAGSLLDVCHRDRIHLQNKVYELRKDIEHLGNKVSSSSRPELDAARRKIDELTRENSRLESQLRSTHHSETAEIRQCQAHLRECTESLNDMMAHISAV